MNNSQDISNLGYEPETQVPDFINFPPKDHWYALENGAKFAVEQYNKENTADGDWIVLMRSDFKTYLKTNPWDRVRAMKFEGEACSPLELEIQDTVLNRSIDLYGNFAGLKKGLHRFGNKKILVLQETPLIEPKEGSWQNLYEYFMQLFGVYDNTDNSIQYALFMLWVRRHLKALYEKKPTQCLALVLSGEAGTGKSLTRKLLEECMGNSTASAFSFMSGKDSFNKEMFESVIWKIDDEDEGNTFNARTEFKKQIKMIVSQDDLRCRGMHKEAVTLKTHKALVICTNTSPDALKILPEPEAKKELEVWDKILLLKCFKTEPEKWPFPFITEKEKQDAVETLIGELPYFVHDLLYNSDWESISIDKKYFGHRFGVRAWQNPEIMEILRGSSKESEFLIYLKKLYDPLKDCQRSFEIDHESFLERVTETHRLRLADFQHSKIEKWCCDAQRFGIIMSKVVDANETAFEKKRRPGCGRTYYVFTPSELL